jgi:hypothetical protein
MYRGRGLHRLTSQCTVQLKTIEKHRAHGIRPSIIRLALIPIPSPKIEAAVIASINIGFWYRSCSWRRYANEEIAQPSIRHDANIRAGEGSKKKEKWPGSNARIWDSGAS